MTWLMIGLCVVYVLGFILIFYANAQMGMISPALTLLRALVWPVFLATGRPRGRRF